MRKVFSLALLTALFMGGTAIAQDTFQEGQVIPSMQTIVCDTAEQVADILTVAATEGMDQSAQKLQEYYLQKNARGEHVCIFARVAFKIIRQVATVEDIPGGPSGLFNATIVEIGDPMGDPNATNYFAFVPGTVTGSSGT